MREPAKELKGRDDVLAWARETLEAGGVKFTPLSKSSQYEIAKVIEEYNSSRIDAIRKYTPQPIQNPNPVQKPYGVDDDEATKEPTPDAESTPCVEKGEDSIPDLPCHGTTNGGTCGCHKDGVEKPKTRAEHYHSLKELPQKVYDDFAKHCETHPQERTVMDFQTGEKSGAAAFAYWLLGRVGEELTKESKPKAKDVMNDWDA